MRLATLLMLLVLTLSSGFAQFAMHMCDDSGVLLATESCTDADKCCGDNAKDGDDHCSTEYIYMLTAKYQNTWSEADFKTTFFDRVLTSLRDKKVGLSWAKQSKYLDNYTLRQSSTDLSFSGVFLI